MFAVGFGDAVLKIDVPGMHGGHRIITAATFGASVELAVFSKIVNMMDIEFSLKIANSSLTFSSGSFTDTVSIRSVPPLTWFKSSLALLHAGSAWKGNETVECVSFVSRPSGAPSWNPRIYPSAGHTDTVLVR